MSEVKRFRGGNDCKFEWIAAESKTRQENWHVAREQHPNGSTCSEHRRCKWHSFHPPNSDVQGSRTGLLAWSCQAFSCWWHCSWPVNRPVFYHCTSVLVQLSSIVLREAPVPVGFGLCLLVEWLREKPVTGKLSSFFQIISANKNVSVIFLTRVEPM